MATDFRTYTDPGVYIETITPPTVFTAAIEPTILAIVGEAPLSRSEFETLNLETTVWNELVSTGADPSTLKAKGSLTQVPFVTGAFGTLDAAVSAGDTGFVINLFDADWIEPAANFTARIEDEEVTVTVAASSVTTGVYTATVTRAANATVAAQHDEGQVINQIELYSTTPSVEVAEFQTYHNATTTTFVVNKKYGVQLVTLSAFSGTDDFKLTYDGVESAIITRGTNATAAGIATVLEAMSNIDDVTVTGTTDAGPFTITFLDPNTDVTALSVTSPTGCTGVVTTVGVSDDTYLDVDGERIIVTAVVDDSSTQQTLTVVRGAGATTAVSHGATNVIYSNSGADYIVKVGTGDDDSLLSGDDTTFVRILDTTRIANGDPVAFSMDVTDAAQFSSGLFNDLDDVFDKYGAPLASDGSVNSDLSLGAQLAFYNGATQVVLVATNPNDSDPFQDAIDKLAFEEMVNSIVVLSGNSLHLSYARGHVEQQSEQGNLRRAFLSLDGLASPNPTTSDFITKAGQLESERVTLVAPARFLIDTGNNSTTVVAGYFAAAAAAGLQAGFGPAEPLTRKQVFGFVGIDDQDTTQNAFSMQAAGVLVIWKDRFDRLIIKHGLTTDMSSVYTREISIVTARDRLRDFVLETLEGGSLVGSPMIAETPNLVAAAVTSALEEAVTQNLIFEYSDVKFRFPTSNPTLIEVRFSYKPTLPLNYILVQFNIDTTTGNVEFQNINEDTTN